MIRLSAGELVLNRELAERAKRLGIDLKEFTPLAKEHVKDGGKYSGGALGYDNAAGLSLDGEKEKPFKKFVGNLFSGEGDGSFWGSDAMKYGAYASMFAEAKGIKPSRIPMAQVVPPSLYSKSYNTDFMVNQNRTARIGAMDFAKARGVNPLQAATSLHAQETENNLRIGSELANYETQVENKNTDLLNNYNQNRANSIYQRSIAQLQENKENAIRTGAMKGEAIAGIINTATGAEQRSFDVKNYNRSALASTAANRTYAFIQANSDKLPQGANKDTIFDLVLKGYSDEQIKKHFGI